MCLSSSQQVLRSDQALRFSSSLEKPQRWRVHNLSGQPVPMLEHPVWTSHIKLCLVLLSNNCREPKSLALCAHWPPHRLCCSTGELLVGVPQSHLSCRLNKPSSPSLSSQYKRSRPHCFGGLCWSCSVLSVFICTGESQTECNILDAV